MSYSSLWTMNNKYEGIVQEEFDNAWLVSPIIWDVLFQKYLPERTTSQFGTKTTFMTASMFDDTIHFDLNDAINNSPVFEDRIAWEMSMQQVFFTKDKWVVAQALRRFFTVNEEHATNCGDHIFERFEDLSKHIENLSEEEFPYFIFKNTSVDDNVVYWFNSYDEDSDEHSIRPLSEMDENVTQFVVIEDKQIKEFLPNLDYFKQLEDIK